MRLICRRTGYSKILNQDNLRLLVATHAVVCNRIVVNAEYFETVQLHIINQNVIDIAHVIIENKL